jgi:hypothetical protein
MIIITEINNEIYKLTHENIIYKKNKELDEWEFFFDLTTDKKNLEKVRKLIYLYFDNSITLNAKGKNKLEKKFK